MMALFGRLVLAVAVMLAAGCSGSAGVAPAHGTPLNGAAIHMIDALDGWAYGGRLIGRTSDGARTFGNVTPQGMAAGAHLDRPFFLDAEHAFVFAITWDGPRLKTSVLERMADGGSTWQATAFNPAVEGDLTFVDAAHGWLVSGQNSSDNLNITETLWRSVDGGASWTPAYAYTYRVDVHPSAEPGGCYWAGSISWSSATHGVVGVACPLDAPLAIDVTDDAGATWSRRALPPLPARSGVVLFSAVDVVRFFAGGQVISTVSRCVGVDESSCTPYDEVYRSSDGRVTWGGGERFRGGDSFESTDPDHSWTVGCIDDACTAVGLLATIDGGARWSLYPLRKELGPNMHGIRIYSFVTAQVGFVTASDEFSPRDAYFETADGGQTFNAFAPVLFAQAG